MDKPLSVDKFQDSFRARLRDCGVGDEKNCGTLAILVSVDMLNCIDS